MAEPTQPGDLAGEIRNVPTLDLSQVNSPDDLGAISRIENVSMVLVARSLAGAIWRIPMENVGAIIPVPDGARISVHTGAITLGGDALADPGDNDVLIVTGALIFTTPVTKVGYRELIVTGSVLAPTGSEAALGVALTRMTGGVDYFTYAEGQRIDKLAGEIRVGGEYLTNPNGSPDDVLSVGGQLVVTGQVSKVGYQRIFVGGVLVAPRDSRTVIESALTIGGTALWYGGNTPRVFGSQTFGNDFFELVDEPLTMIITDDVEFEPDVDPDLVRTKVQEVASLGTLTASRRLAPVLQYLAVENHGEIHVRSDT